MFHNYPLCKHFTYLITTLMLASSFVYIWHNIYAKCCDIIVNTAMALATPLH